MHHAICPSKETMEAAVSRGTSCRMVRAYSESAAHDLNRIDTPQYSPHSECSTPTDRLLERATARRAQRRCSLHGSYRVACCLLLVACCKRLRSLLGLVGVCQVRRSQAFRTEGASSDACACETNMHSAAVSMLATLCSDAVKLVGALHVVWRAV